MVSWADLCSFHALYLQSNLSYPDSCYPGTSLNRAADLLYFMLTLQKLWAVQWAWPITAYVFILYSEIRTNLSYGHPLIPRRPDKRGLTVLSSLPTTCLVYFSLCFFFYQIFDTLILYPVSSNILYLPPSSS